MPMWRFLFGLPAQGSSASCSVPTRSTAGAPARAPTRKRRRSLPTYIPVTNWRWSSARWISIRKPSICVQLGMYDMPKYGVPNRGNFLINMLRQPEASFSSTQHRAVTYVREVSGLIRQAALLPGGEYNYGSENNLTMLETAEWLKDTLDLPVKLRGQTTPEDKPPQRSRGSRGPEAPEVQGLTDVQRLRS